MHDIIEHYGKVIVALAGVLAAVLLAGAGVKINSLDGCGCKDCEYQDDNGGR